MVMYTGRGWRGRGMRGVIHFMMLRFNRCYS